MTEFYRVHVQGHLDDHWSDWLEGLVIHRQPDGTTELVGPIVDQAALHGMIARIRDLGLPLLAVIRVDSDLNDGQTPGNPSPQDREKGVLQRKPQSNDLT